MSRELERIREFAGQVVRRTPARWLPAVTLHHGTARVLYAGIILAPRLQPAALPKVAFRERSLMSLVEGTDQHETEIDLDYDKLFSTPPGLDVLADLRQPLQGPLQH